MNNTDLTKTSINLAIEFPNEYRHKVIKLAVSSFLPTALDRSKTIDNLCRDSALTRGDIYEVLGVYITLLRIYLQTNDNEYNEKLIELGFPPEFIEQMPFLGNREDIIDNLQKSFSTDFGKLSTFKWRIDISLGNSILAKKVPNYVLLSIGKKDGSKYTIELDPQMFHKLRFNIALILNELNSLKAGK